MDSYQIVSEALLFNQKDTVLRFDDWVSGKIKNLYILGYIGSGKSTTSENLHKQYGGRYYEMDYVRDQMVDVNIGKSKKSEDQLYDEMLEFCVKKAKTTNQRLIWEGIDVLWIDRKWVLSQAVIVKGTSYFTSTWRAHIRNVNRRDTAENPGWTRGKTNWQIFKDTIRNQQRFHKHIGQFRKEVLAAQ